MHIVIAIILFIHGSLHLPGFFKAFELTKIEALKLPIPRTYGIAWFFASMLFDLSAILLLFDFHLWWSVAFAGLLLSQLLILRFWRDARYGSLINILIAVTVISGYSGQVYRDHTAAQRDLLITISHTAPEIDIQKELPGPVRKWIERSGADTIKTPKAVVIKQDLILKTDPEQEDWYASTAEQYISISEPAFIWNMILERSILTMQGRDIYMGQKGEMEIRVNNFPAIRESGPKTNEASLQRYLAEIVWAPWAAASHHIEWLPKDSLTVEAFISDSDLKTSGTFVFNHEGDVSSFSTLRYMGSKKDAERHEWIVEIKNYGRFNGIRIPAESEVSWMINGRKWTWLKVYIKDTELIY